MKLIRTTGPMPPGGYPFTDPRTGLRFHGMEGQFDLQVRRIIAHRLANPTVYPQSDPKWLSIEYVAGELSDYTCQRLGNNPKFCGDGSIKSNSKTFAVAGVCGSCGGALKAMYCKTCTRQRLVGYECTQCGKKIDR